ncbi:MAG: serine phosphatase RsbU (regulator of sigma subunit) [Oceanicoccus sp.]|jgi:serine phosphatase RsbU (regulator of sigma subunit)
MFRSLKAKFTLAFGSLIVILFLSVGAFLLDAKSREMAGDISESTQLYAQLSTTPIMEDYFNYLEPGNFIPFQRELSALLRRNSDVESVSISTYKGVVLFDSLEETDEQYSGTLRTVNDQNEIDRVQANHISILMNTGELIFVRVNEDKSIEYVDANEKSVMAPSDRNRVLDIVVPYDNAYAVQYFISYETLEARLATARMQIIIVGIIGLILALMISFMLSVSITNPIKELKSGALKLGKGDFKVRVKVKSKDEVGVLAHTFNKMAQDLEASTEARVYQERVQKELELAAQIQQELLPAEKMELAHLDVAGGLIPASEIGGDAFDYIEMDNGKHLFYIGDVTGHGVAAGLISSITNAMLYGLRGEAEITNVIHKLNEVVRAKTMANVFVTMALVFWDDAQRSLRYINAGHPPILYYDAKKKKVIEITQQGMALGFVDDLSQIIKPQSLKLGEGDVVVMYSDGVPEAMNRKGAQYGMAKFKRIVQDAANDLYTSEGIKNAVLSDVIEYIDGQEHDDDITVVVLKGKD